MLTADQLTAHDLFHCATNHTVSDDRWAKYCWNQIERGSMAIMDSRLVAGGSCQRFLTEIRIMTLFALLPVPGSIHLGFAATWLAVLGTGQVDMLRKR